MKTTQNAQSLTNNNEDTLKRLIYVNANKRRGDVAAAAEVLNIPYPTAQMALERIGSKHHDNVVNALHSIITHRESLKNNSLSPVN